jgi:replicative DNA helicase
MDAENLLVTKAIQSGKLSDVVARGIEPDHFLDDDAHDVFTWAVDHLRQYNEPPTMAAAKREFPRWKPHLTKDPLAYCIDLFIDHVRYYSAVEGMRRFSEQIDDPEAIREIETYAWDMFQQITEAVPAPRATRLSEGSKRKEDYYRRKERGDQQGIKIGIPSIDTITLGIQPHEFVIFAGPSGAGKTTAQEYTAFNAYVQGKSALFISLENDAEQVRRKLEVFLTGVSAHALKALELEGADEEKWLKMLERCEAEAAERDIVIVGDIRNCSVAKVAAEQQRYRPHLIVVDYLEMMREGRKMSHWESVQEAGRGLKQLARVGRVPVVTGTQISRDSGETAYQSAQKIADMLFVLHPPHPDSDVQDGQMGIELRKYRDGRSRKYVVMEWDLENGEIKEIPERSTFMKERPKLGRKRVNSNGRGPANIAGARKLTKERK